MAEFLRVAGGVQSPSPALATADQVSIAGSGTAQDPLRVVGSGGGGGDLVATYVQTDPVHPYVGEVVALSGETPVEGTQASVTNCNPGVGENPYGIGMIVKVEGTAEGTADPFTVTVRTSGIVTLPVEDWLQTTQGSGLEPSRAYYSSVLAVGALDPTPTSLSGVAVSQVGVALSETAFLLSTPCAPRFNP